jgi:hypothetical protein
MSEPDLDAELSSYGLENCRCPYDETAEDKTCVVCSERVRYVNHTHFKSELYHETCLVLALLRQLNQRR